MDKANAHLLMVRAQLAALGETATWSIIVMTQIVGTSPMVGIGRWIVIKAMGGENERT